MYAIYVTMKGLSLIVLLLSVSPVLLSSKHLSDGIAAMEKKPSFGDCDERVLRPMRWGLIPSWYHGDISSMEYKMNNARSDGMLVKTSFKRPLQSGRRCVVVADGYLLLFIYLFRSISHTVCFIVIIFYVKSHLNYEILTVFAL